MKRFYLHSNPSRDEGYALRDLVEKHLNGQGAICRCSDEYDRPPADTECVIVLGGDGTLLRTVRRFNDMDLRYVGINTGHLGYLAAGDRDMIPLICESLIRDEYVVETRMEIYARTKVYLISSR